MAIARVWPSSLATPEAGGVEIDWLLRDKRTSEGLDHLGVQVVSANLYDQLLPGITNVTERARFCAFYPWLVHRFAKAELEAGDRRRWLDWFRAAEFTYALCCAAARKLDGGEITGVTGTILARRMLQKLAPSAIVEIRDRAVLDERGEVPKGAYIAMHEGGYSQYKNALVKLGVLYPAPHLRYPDVQLTSYAGKPIAEALDEKGLRFLELLDIAASGSASVSDLAEVGRRVQPSAIVPDSPEQTLLRALIRGEDSEVCKGQLPVERRWRGASLLLMLGFVRECSELDDDFVECFRWSCATRILPTGDRWEVPVPLEQVARAWGVYHRNDLLCVALDALFYACLADIGASSPTPRALAHRAAELASAPVDIEGEGTLPALEGSVAKWVEACRCPPGDDAAAWGAKSTYAWTNALFEAVSAGETAAIYALAARLLGRLATDIGTFSEHGFGLFPRGETVASAYEVHLGAWLKRTHSRRDSELRAVLEEILLEWVLFRHLRVSTRKLATQGISTFKLRPEEGRLLRVADEMSTVGFTSPRLRQAHRYLIDVGYLDETSGGVALAGAGAEALSGAGL
jgi:hypothetical protein